MTTYNTLFSDIKEYANRSDPDFINQIPNFIKLAEEQICRECINIGLIQDVVSDPLNNGGGFIIGNPYVEKPIDWRRTLSFTHGANNIINTMENRSIDFIDLYWPDPNKKGKPIYYSDDTIGFWKIAPVPDSNYPFIISYLQKPLPLSVYNQTNWLTDFIPDIFLYCCLINTMPFLKDDERLPLWKSEYKEKVNALNIQNNNLIIDRMTTRQAV